MAKQLNLDTSQELDLSIVEGIDYSLECDVTDENGASHDLTGASVKIELREDINSATADISFVSPTDITVSGNVFTWNISSAKTASKGGHDYYYGVQVIDVATLKHLFIKGVITINEVAVG
ncbi:MAG: hypothetical protein ACYC56_14385 [Candidatus Aquicultor sp.]